MKVLVLGAGFGGLELTTRLSDELGEAIEVVLIDQSDSFVFGFSKLDVMFGRTTANAVHHAYRGGLLEHVLKLAEVGELLARAYGADPDLLLAAALLAVRPIHLAVAQSSPAQTALAPSPRGSESRVAASSGNVQHAPTCLEIGGFAELLSLIDNSGGDDGEVATRPGRLLAVLHGSVIRILMRRADRSGTDGGHV